MANHLKMMCACGIFAEEGLKNGLFCQSCVVFHSYMISHELCDQIQLEVDCAKSHHHVISVGLFYIFISLKIKCPPKFLQGMNTHKHYILYH